MEEREHAGLRIAIHFPMLTNLGDLNLGLARSRSRRQ